MLEAHDDGDICMIMSHTAKEFGGQRLCNVLLLSYHRVEAVADSWTDMDGLFTWCFQHVVGLIKISQTSGKLTGLGVGRRKVSASLLCFRAENLKCFTRWFGPFISRTTQWDDCCCSRMVGQALIGRNYIREQVRDSGRELSYLAERQWECEEDVLGKNQSFLAQLFC